MIFPDIAAARAVVKLGSFVKEEAICSIKKCRSSGESTLGCELLTSVSSSGFIKSRVTVGPDELREAERGTEPGVARAFDPHFASSRGDPGWLCSPS